MVIKSHCVFPPLPRWSCTLLHGEHWEGGGFPHSCFMSGWPQHSLNNDKKIVVFYYYYCIYFFSTEQAEAKPRVRSPALSLTWDMLQPPQMQK